MRKRTKSVSKEDSRTWQRPDSAVLLSHDGRETVLLGELGQGWVYEMAVVLQRGRCVVSRLCFRPYSAEIEDRVRRDHDDRAMFCEDFEKWLAERATDESDGHSELRVPDGGFTSTHLRTFKFRESYAYLAGVSRPAIRLAAIYGVGTGQRRRRAKPRGRAAKYDPLHLAEVAKRYVEACRFQKNPGVLVAQQTGLSTTQVRDRVFAARRRGLLTATRAQGIGGGELTKRARELLQMNTAPKPE